MPRMKESTRAFMAEKIEAKRGELLARLPSASKIGVAVIIRDLRAANRLLAQLKRVG